MSSCRCARSPPSAGASIARSRMVRCSTCSCSTCAAIAARTARAMSDTGRPFLGPAQIAWLKRELAALTRDLEGDRRRPADRADQLRRGRRRATAPPLGRELEIADLLSFIKHAGVRNTVWITADMHYTAAHYYDPNRAVFQDFAPFWEFMSGPDPCRHRRSGAARQYVRPARGLPKACSKEQGDEPRALLRPAVLRPCGDRRRHAAYDGDAEGRRGSRAVGDRAGAAAPILILRSEARSAERLEGWRQTPALPGHPSRRPPSLRVVGLLRMRVRVTPRPAPCCRRLGRRPSRWSASWPNNTRRSGRRAALRA